MDDETFQPRGVAGKGMGFVKNAGNKNSGHDPHPWTDKLSVVFLTAASDVALHHWRKSFFAAPCCKQGTDLLILKLTIVPLALLVFGIVERLHGPRVAGWLAGFPIVAGPILLLLALDRGGGFAAAAALGGYFGLVPWLAFTACYAWCSRKWRWPLAALVSFTLWAVAAAAMIQLE